MIRKSENIQRVTHTITEAEVLSLIRDNCDSLCGDLAPVFTGDTSVERLSDGGYRIVNEFKEAKL